MSNKPHLSISQIINMNVGFLGTQYSFGLQQTAINPIYSFLGADPAQLPLNLAEPLFSQLLGAIKLLAIIHGVNVGDVENHSF